MAWTDLEKLAVGKAIPKEFLDALVDNLAWLKGQPGQAGLPNGSFEEDLDGDGVPDGWALSVYAGGSYALTADAAHGAQALALTATGTGGYVEVLGEEYLPTAYGERVELAARLKATTPGVRVRGNVLWYNAARTYLATSTVYDSASNPTTYAERSGQVVAPASAAWYRVQWIAGTSGGAVAATVTLDGVEARRFRGWVQINRTSVGTGGTIAATAHAAAGEVPRKARVWVSWIFDPLGTSATGTFTLSGNGKTVLSESGTGAGSHWAVVECDAAGQFTCSLTGGSALGSCFLFGYEV